MDEAYCSLPGSTSRILPVFLFGPCTPAPFGPDSHRPTQLLLGKISQQRRRYMPSSMGRTLTDSTTLRRSSHASPPSMLRTSTPPLDAFATLPTRTTAATCIPLIPCRHRQASSPPQWPKTGVEVGLGRSQAWNQGRT
jgi:hypothetical protein